MAWYSCSRSYPSDNPGSAGSAGSADSAGTLSSVVEPSAQGLIHGLDTPHACTGSADTSLVKCSEKCTENVWSLMLYIIRHR